MRYIEKIKRFIKRRVGKYEEEVEAYQDMLLCEELSNEVKEKLQVKRDRIWYRDDEALEILRYITKLESEENEKGEEKWYK